MPEYRFLFDETFLIESLRKYRKQHGTRYASLAIKSIAGLLLLALAAFSAWQIDWWLALFFCALVLLMFNGHLIDYWLIRRRFRKSPYRNENMVSILTAEGLHAVSPQSDSRLAWSVFTKARSFSDGVLLFQGPGVFNWLPDTALSDGSRTEVDSLIRARVKDYRIVEPNAGQVSSEAAPSATSGKPSA